jgi:hypothetical protein
MAAADFSTLAILSEVLHPIYGCGKTWGGVKPRYYKHAIEVCK